MHDLQEGNLQQNFLTSLRAAMILENSGSFANGGLKAIWGTNFKKAEAC